MIITDERLKKVVLIEGWSVMRKFMEDILQKVVGYELYIVLRDAKSLEKYIKGNNIALIIMDITSSDENEILETVKRIRAMSPDTRIILTTITSSAVLVEKAKAAGANGVWQKEISESSFIKACALL
ncbi:MAG: response regulator [Lachnospiraceae bacterium]|nr:response regulator [Lachnospiraceae bacterium]